MRAGIKSVNHAAIWQRKRVRERGERQRERGRDRKRESIEREAA